MGQIQDLISSAGIKMPALSGIFGGILGFLIFVVVSIGMAIIVWKVINNLNYNKKIIIFSKIGNRFEPSGNDKAKEFHIGDSGETVLFLKKRKVWRVGEKQASKNTYWFAVLDDGYWYNVTLGDFNKNLGEFDVTGINPEMHKLMRYQNAGLRKNLKDRLIKKKWYEHPLIAWIGAIIFVIVVGIFFVMIAKYYFAELPNTLTQLNTLLERINNLIEILQKMGCKG